MIEANIIDFKIKNKNFYCLWYSDKEEMFVINKKKLIYFNNILELKERYDNIYKIDKKIVTYDIDQIIRTCNSNDKLFDYKQIMDFWNIISDLSKTLKTDFYGNSREKIIDNVYNKLFRSLNLPIVTEPGKEYNPVWTEEEQDVIKKMLIDGISLLYNIFSDNTQ